MSLKKAESREKSYTGCHKNENLDLTNVQFPFHKRILTTVSDFNELFENSIIEQITVDSNNKFLIRMLTNYIKQYNLSTKIVCV